MPKDPILRNPAISQDFARQLLTLRAARGWSQQVLADSANINKKTLYRIEKGRCSPTLDVVASLAFALELPVAELLRFEPAPPPSGE